MNWRIMDGHKYMICSQCRGPSGRLNSLRLGYTMGKMDELEKLLENEVGLHDGVNWALMERGALRSIQFQVCGLFPRCNFFTSRKHETLRKVLSFITCGNSHNYYMTCCPSR